MIAPGLAWQRVSPDKTWICKNLKSP